MIVSTHSRLKAAGKSILRITNEIYCFNTQPPEGGWLIIAKNRDGEMGFNTQPPEGGWLLIPHSPNVDFVSTHSRLKAAGFGSLSYQV
mgnify:CR=1 FL=1